MVIRRLTTRTVPAQLGASCNHDVKPLLRGTGTPLTSTSDNSHQGRETPDARTADVESDDTRLNERRDGKRPERNTAEYVSLAEIERAMEDLKPQESEPRSVRDRWLRPPPASLEHSSDLHQRHSAPTFAHAAVSDSEEGDAMTSLEPTSEHDAVPAPSSIISGCARELEAHGVEYIEFWPLHRFSNDAEEFGGLAWTLNAVAERFVDADDQRLASVTLRLKSRRMLTWLRHRGHALLVITDVAWERRLLGIVARLEKEAAARKG